SFPSGRQKAVRSSFILLQTGMILARIPDPFFAVFPYFLFPYRYDFLAALDCIFIGPVAVRAVRSTRDNHNCDVGYFELACAMGDRCDHTRPSFTDFLTYLCQFLLGHRLVGFIIQMDSARTFGPFPDVAGEHADCPLAPVECIWMIFRDIQRFFCNFILFHMSELHSLSHFILLSPSYLTSKVFNTF